MRTRPVSPPLPDLRWSPMAALAAPKASLRPFLLASLLVHLGLIFLGQRLIRPGGGGEAGFGEAPPGFERALPGTAGLPAGMRLGWVELSPAIRMVALGTPTPKAGPPAPAAVAPEPVVVPAESPAAEDQSPALESALGTSTTGEATGPAGDPAGSPAGEATGGGGGDGGGGGGSGGAGGGSGGPATDFVRGRDTLPVVQSMTVPDYPPEAKGRSRVPVVLLVHVTADGTVDDVRRGEATDCPPCEAAAIKSAWQLRFTPGTRDGVPAAMWVRYPVTFGRK